MKSRRFYKELSKLMLPIALQTFMLSLVTACDSFMLGAISQDALAAVSLASKIAFVENIGIAGLVGGGMVLFSQYFGKNDLNTVGKIFSLILRYAIIICIVFFCLSFFVPNFLMKIFTDDLLMIEIGAKYLRIAAFSFLIVGITQVYLIGLKTANKASYCALISGIAVIINIILNVIFIFGLNMEASGAALATVIARIIEFVLAVFIFKRSGSIKFNKKDIFKISSKLEKEFWKVSSFLLLNELIWGVGITIYSVILGHLGSDATAADSIASVVKDLTTSLCRGVGVGGGIMVGYKLGKNDFDGAKTDGRRLLFLSIIVGVVCGVLVMATSFIVLPFVKLTDVSKNYLKYMFIISAFYMIAKSINITLINGVFYVGGDTFFDTYSLGVIMWGCIVPLGLLGTFVFNWPVILLYFILSMDETIKIPWVIHHYKKYKWLNNLTN